jgi:hypothetical protein
VNALQQTLLPICILLPSQPLSLPNILSQLSTNSTTPDRTQLPFSTTGIMQLTNILLIVFSSATMASPATLSMRGDEACTPTAYTISDYTLVTSPTSASVDFTFKSTFSSADTINDSVQDGAHCSASGSSVPNSNECQVANRRLLFDLRGPQEQAYYQITHTWSCNG